MNESQAKRQLARMRRSFTSGSVLHLLADLHGEIAEEARQADDASTFRQHKSIEAALIVMGMGIDAATSGVNSNRAPRHQTTRSSRSTHNPLERATGAADQTMQQFEEKTSAAWTARPRSSGTT